MSGQRLLKTIFFICFSLMLLLVCIFYLDLERHAGTELATISPQALEELEQGRVLDMAMLRLHGEAMAADTGSGTLYMPADEAALRDGVQLSGLSCMAPGVKLYILEDEAYAAPQEAIAANRPFGLIAVKGGSYQRIELVLTPFPVLNMQAVSSRLNWDERTMYAGSYSLFDGTAAPDTGRAEWIDRGATSATLPKAPFRFCPKKLNGSDMKVELLDLGSDDEWVLNALGFDDTKLREVFAMQFWNRYIADEERGSFNMSEGRWVELVLNGRYHGLFYLQRYIDADYLPIDREKDLMFKGLHSLEAETLEENYEIVWSPYSQQESYRLLDACLNFRDGCGISAESFLDFQCLLDLISGRDNNSFKNCYYVLQPEGDGYSMKLVPWDTDMSFGLCYNGALYYNYELSVNTDMLRIEYGTMQQNVPGFEQMREARWRQLREEAMNCETIFPMFEAIKAELDASGALIRDFERWGYIHGGVDEYEQLFKFTEERLAFLDEHILGGGAE